MAGDLTTRQQKVIKDYRDRGQRAYSKGNKLVMAGSLPPRRWNQNSYADAARRQHHRQDNPGTVGAAVRTSTAHPTQETAGRVLQNRRAAGSRLPTELQTTAGRMAAIDQQLVGKLQPVVRRSTGEGGSSAGAASSLRPCPLRVGRTGLPALHRLGRRGHSPLWQHQRRDPARPRTLRVSINSRLAGLL